MIEPFQFVIVVLCAFRVTRFLVFDSMMGANLESQSKWSQKVDVFAYTADGENRSWLRGKIGDLLVCPYCTGFWVSIGVLAAWYYGAEIVHWIIIGWAVAGAQCMLNKWDHS